MTLTASGRHFAVGQGVDPLRYQLASFELYATPDPRSGPVVAG